MTTTLTKARPTTRIARFIFTAATTALALSGIRGLAAAADLATVVGGRFAAVVIPKKLATPPAATLKLRLHAIGAQIYTCAAGGDGRMFAWTLHAPEAKLYDEAHLAVVGSHSTGPTWVFQDGSVVVGSKMAQDNAPGTGDIPWLLLRAVSHQGSGVLADVTYVQRVNTSMGQPPTGGCDATTVGKIVFSNYTADYYFYAGGSESGS